MTLEDILASHAFDYFRVIQGPQHEEPNRFTVIFTLAGTTSTVLELAASARPRAGAASYENPGHRGF